MADLGNISFLVLMDQEECRTLRHEARTFMSHIIGYAELLSEDAAEINRKGMLDDLLAIRTASAAILSFIGEAITTEGAVSGRLTAASLEEEFRFPMHSIISYSELLREEATDRGWIDTLSDLRKIALAGRRLLTLVCSSLGLHLTPAEQVIGSSAYPSEPAPDPGSGQGAAREVVLIVDDSAMSREILRRRLQRLGHSVQQAADGQTALAMLQRNPPDLLLLDIVMPGMSGYEVLAAVRSDDALSALPVLVMSAADSQEWAAACLERGADGYLTTPVSTSDLESRIVAAVEKRRSAAKGE